MSERGTITGNEVHSKGGSLVRSIGDALATLFVGLIRWVAASTGFALLFFSACRCGPPEPIALIPIPPGVDYPWRTELGQPDPYEMAAFRRARLVVANAHVGADYYAEHWESLPAVGADARVAEQVEAAAPAPRRAEAPRSSRASSDDAAEELQVAESDGSVDTAERLEPASELGAAAPPAGSLIDINTASSRQLESLSGIGPSLAARIIDGRPYRRVRDLLDVRGIGPRTLERFETQISVR
jgi:competence protein ComEA